MADASVAPGRWIRSGWQIVREDMGTFLLLTLIAVALTMVGWIIVAGPLLAGLFVAVRRRMLEGRMDVGDLFSGFSLGFIDSLLIFLLSMIFTLVGMALCLFPALIVMALYLYPYLYMIDRKLSFWEAMEASRKRATEHLAGYTVFVFLLLLLNLLGLLLAGVGVLFTIPITVAAIAVAYKETEGFVQRPPESHRPIVIE